MPVKVRVELKSRRNSRTVTTTAFVNTGFMSETPDIALPPIVAEQLGLWPRPCDALLVTLETGGGSIEAYIVPQGLTVKVIAQDRTSREVIANALVNPHLDDVLIGDALAEELDIQILYPRKGIWRFADEEVMRKSED